MTPVIPALEQQRMNNPDLCNVTYLAHCRRRPTVKCAVIRSCNCVPPGIRYYCDVHAPCTNWRMRCSFCQDHTLTFIEPVRI